MTLRARLAVAFGILVLGPALAGAGLVVTAVTASGPQEPARQGLSEAVIAVRAAVAARCAALEVAARALADQASVRGVSFVASPGGDYGPWAICGAGPAPAPAGTRYGALAARAEIRDSDGVLRGYAYALQPLDEAYLRQLSAAAGVAVSVRAAGEATEPGWLVPDAAQPLPLALSPPASRPGAGRPGSGWPIVAVAGAAVVLAAAFGWWLAGIATRPLATLLATVERVVAGDVSSRSRVGGSDEAGRLGHGLDMLIAGLQESQRLSVTDPLTGLGNLRHLRDSLRMEVERATRFDRAVGLLVIDLDHFKSVNDHYGHWGGDAVLVEFARRICGVIREVDIPFRQGGEEFVILLPETDVPGSLTAARRIRDAVRDRPFALNHPTAPARALDARIPVTVSIGVAVFPRHGVTGSEVLDAADEALYAAKAAGRDTYVLASTAVPDQRTPPDGPTLARATGPDSREDAGGGSSGTSSPRSGRAR